MIHQGLKCGLVLVLCCSFASGCERWQRDRVTFDGMFFPASAKPVDRRDRTQFVATVRRADQSEDAARQAVAYEGVKYCIKWFGISNIDWEIDPGADAFQIDGDTVSANGTCTE